MSEWRFIAQRLPSGEFLDWDLPLTDVQVTSELSGPGGLVGTVPVEVARLKAADGRPLLEPYGCAVWAEASGQIRGGGILVDSYFDGQSWRLDCVGLSGYLSGMPWTGGEYSGVQVDPLGVVRRVWNHAQSQVGGDLGVVVDSTSSPVRVGTKKEDVEFTTNEGKDVAFEAGPFLLTPWTTHDLGKVVDDLAQQTPFDYVNHTAWSGDTLVHRLELAYPRRGSRREDLRFVVGENVTIDPTQTMDGADYASEVLVLGAGEGRKMVRASVAASRDRLRRVAVVTDKSVRSKSAATSLGRLHLAARTGVPTISEVVVTDGPLASISSIVVGDEVFVQSEAGWVDLAMWVRVVAITVSPDEVHTARLRVVSV